MDNRDYYLTITEGLSATSQTYIGEAPLGSAQTDAKWRLMLVSETSAVTRVQYAGGVNDFCHVWNDRASYTYS
jgi:hypothetical protein